MDHVHKYFFKYNTLKIYNRKIPSQHMPLKQTEFRITVHKTKFLLKLHWLAKQWMVQDLPIQLTVAEFRKLFNRFKYVHKWNNSNKCLQNSMFESQLKIYCVLFLISINCFFLIASYYKNSSSLYFLMTSTISLRKWMHRGLTHDTV